MNSNIKYLALAASSLLLLFSCQKENTDFVDEATRVTPQATSAQFNADGTTSDGASSFKTVIIVNNGAALSNADWTASVDGNASYATVKQVTIPFQYTEPVTKKQYSRDEKGIEVTVTPNTEYKRKFTVTVKCGEVSKTLSFVQLGVKADAKISVESESVQFKADGETKELAYTSNMGDVVAYKVTYAGSTKDWLTCQKSDNGVKLTASKWTDKNNGRSAVLTIVIGTEATSIDSATVNVSQLSADDVFFIWGNATKKTAANALQMDAVEAGVSKAQVQIYPSKGNIICINKNETGESYPVYYLANDGTIKQSSSKVASSDLKLELVGLYEIETNFNTMKWTWKGASKVEDCMPDSEWSKYTTKSYPAKDGGEKTWMTACLHWDGGSYAKTLKLGCQLTNVAGGGYGSEQPVDRTTPGTFDNIESGGTVQGLEAETNLYGRIYNWIEVLTGKCMGGCGNSADVSAWPQEYCEGHTFTDAVGTEYTMPVGITALGTDDAALEKATPTLAMQIQGICPFGWHVANLQDYRDLFYAAYKAMGKDASTVNYATLTTGDTNVAATLRGAEGWTTTPDRNAFADDFGWNMYPCGRRLYKSGWSNYGVYFESWVCHPGAAGNSDYLTGEKVYKVWRVVTTKATGTMKFNGTFDTGNGSSVIRCVKNYEND